MSDQPWEAQNAAQQIRCLAASSKLKFTYADHVKEELASREVLTGDVLFLLKNGDVYDPAMEASKSGFYKYRMECETPNSNGRALRATLIPDVKDHHIKVLKVQWVNE